MDPSRMYHSEQAHCKCIYIYPRIFISAYIAQVNVRANEYVDVDEHSVIYYTCLNTYIYIYTKVCYKCNL